MAMQPARQYMTFEQYLLLVNNSDRHYEYYDGEVRLVHLQMPEWSSYQIYAGS